MSPKASELGTATLEGSLFGSVLTAVLGLGASAYPDLLALFYPAIGAFIGGIVAAYLFHGKTGQAVRAGMISGILVTPLSFGFADIFVYVGLIPLPTGQNPPLAALQITLVVIAGMDLIAGTLGGAILGTVYHAPKEPSTLPSQVPMGTTPTAEVRYCVQCGAQLPTGTLICPQCNARQPQ